MKNSKRQTLTVAKLSRMMVEAKDVLPAPAEHNGRRIDWVGIGWLDVGKADGTEPLLIIDD